MSLQSWEFLTLFLPRFGQWEAAAVGPQAARGYATPLADFAEDLDALARLVGGLTRRPMWFLATGYSPLGCIRTACPALDRRLPPVADAYNAVARAVAAAHAPRVGFVDTRDIVGPMWDAAPDWCHEGGKVLDAIATRVVAHVKADVAAWADDDGGGAWA